jgi:uncharacterized protein YqjF (DUF2071 family)
MRIVMSPCFICGAHSHLRAEVPYAAFNACARHERELIAHAELLFQRFRLHTAHGQSVTYRLNATTDSWEVGK